MDRGSVQHCAIPQATSEVVVNAGSGAKSLRRTRAALIAKPGRESVVFPENDAPLRITTRPVPHADRLPAPERPRGEFRERAGLALPRRGGRDDPSSVDDGGLRRLRRRWPASTTSTCRTPSVITTSSRRSRATATSCRWWPRSEFLIESRPARPRLLAHRVTGPQVPRRQPGLDLPPGDHPRRRLVPRQGRRTGQDYISFTVHGTDPTGGFGGPVLADINDNDSRFAATTATRSC